jgi:hypothetical protein
MATLKGQNLRVFKDGLVIASATSCQITLTNNTESSSTKDDGMADKPVTVSKSWQVQVDAMEVDDIKTLLDAIKAGTTFTLKWTKATGTGNAQADDTNAPFHRSGTAFISDISFVFEDRKYSTKSITFIGTGALS